MALKSVILSDTAVDLGGISPFLNGGSAVAINLTASAENVVHCDTLGGTYTTAAALSVVTGTTSVATISGLKRYVKLDSAGTVILLASD